MALATHKFKVTRRDASGQSHTETHEARSYMVEDGIIHFAGPNGEQVASYVISDGMFIVQTPPPVTTET